MYVIMDDTNKIDINSGSDDVLTVMEHLVDSALEKNGVYQILEVETFIIVKRIPMDDSPHYGIYISSIPNISEYIKYFGIIDLNTADALILQLLAEYPHSIVMYTDGETVTM